MPADTLAPPAPETTTAAAPPPSTEKALQDYLGGIVDELVQMDAAPPEPTPQPKTTRDDKGKFKPVEKKPEVKTPEKPEEKPTDKPEDKSSEEFDKPEEKPVEPPKPVKAADLRNAYDGLKKKVREELEPELQKLRSKVKEYEEKPPEDSAPILQKLKSVEERNAQLEQQIALVDYEQSTEFSTKYDQPYRQMWEKATNAFNQLTVKEQDGTDDVTGEPKFKMRRATESDLIKLGSLDLSQLDEAAQAMFGASAPRAIQYIERLRELAEAKQNAVVEARAKAGEWKSQRTAEMQQRQKALSTAWNEINNGLKEKFPKAFQPEENDPEDAASHTKGFALADLMFMGENNLTPEQVEALPNGFKETIKAKKPLSEVQKVQLHALARLKMANHDRLLAGRKKDKARIAELEKTLAEYEKSEPSTSTASSGARTGSKAWDEEVADELKALDR